MMKKEKKKKRMINLTNCNNITITVYSIYLCLIIIFNKKYYLSIPEYFLFFKYFFLQFY